MAGKRDAYDTGKGGIYVERMDGWLERRRLTEQHKHKRWQRKNDEVTGR